MRQEVVETAICAVCSGYSYSNIGLAISSASSSYSEMLSSKRSNLEQSLKSSNNTGVHSSADFDDSIGVFPRAKPPFYPTYYDNDPNALRFHHALLEFWDTMSSNQSASASSSSVRRPSHPQALTSKSPYPILNLLPAPESMADKRRNENQEYLNQGGVDVINRKKQWNVVADSLLKPHTGLGKEVCRIYHGYLRQFERDVYPKLSSGASPFLKLLPNLPSVSEIISPLSASASFSSISSIATTLPSISDQEFGRCVPPLLSSLTCMADRSKMDVDNEHPSHSTIFKGKMVDSPLPLQQEDLTMAPEKESFGNNNPPVSMTPANTRSVSPIIQSNLKGASVDPKLSFTPIYSSNVHPLPSKTSRVYYAGYNIDRMLELNHSVPQLSKDNLGKVELNKLLKSLSSGIYSEIDYALHVLLILTSDSTVSLPTDSLRDLINALMRMFLSMLESLFSIKNCVTSLPEGLSSQSSSFPLVAELKAHVLESSSVSFISSGKSAGNYFLSPDITVNYKCPHENVHRIVAFSTVLENITFLESNVEFYALSNLFRRCLYLMLCCPLSQPKGHLILPADDLLELRRSGMIILSNIASKLTLDQEVFVHYISVALDWAENAPFSALGLNIISKLLLLHEKWVSHLPLRQYFRRLNLLLPSRDPDFVGKGLEELMAIDSCLTCLYVLIEAAKLDLEAIISPLTQSSFGLVGHSRRMIATTDKIMTNVSFRAGPLIHSFIAHILAYLSATWHPGFDHHFSGRQISSRHPHIPSLDSVWAKLSSLMPVHLKICERALQILLLIAHGPSSIYLHPFKNELVLLHTGLFKSAVQRTYEHQISWTSRIGDRIAEVLACID